MTAINKIISAQADTFDKEKWIAEKNAELTNAYAMIEETLLDMKEDFSVLPKILSVIARFERMSVANNLLIAHQKSNATKLMDANSINSAGGYINKGARGIILLEPGNEFKRKDGSTARKINTKKMFDISQTNLYSPARGPAKYDIRYLMKAIISNAPCVVEVVRELPDGQNVVYLPHQQKIQLKENIIADHAFHSLAEGMAYAYGDREQIDVTPFLAYCTAFTICEKYNVGNWDFDYSKVPVGFVDKKSMDIRTELNKVRVLTKEIAYDISKTLDKPPQSKDCR